MNELSEVETQPPIGPVPVPAPALPPPRRAFLVTLAGDGVGVVHDLKETSVLGRTDGVDIPIADRGISRKHARIEVKNGAAAVSDLGSRNGTWVNEQLVKDHPLTHGDVLRVGNAVLKFVWGDELTEYLRDSASKARSLLEVTNDELRAAQAQLVQSEKLSALGQVAAGVGHEVMNPLSFIIHNLDFVARELVPKKPTEVPQHQELLDAVMSARDGAERVRAIVQDLQTLGRQSAEPRAPVRVRAAVEVALRMMEPRISAAAMLVTDFNGDPWVLANELRLVQVLVALLNNAVQALREPDPARHRITVTVTPHDERRTVVAIGDTGVGIPPENVHRIFEPYFTTKPVGQGTGLGLAIAQNIVAAHGGAITLKSEPGKGTVFQVVLATCPAQPEATAVERLSTSRPIALIQVGEQMSQLASCLFANVERFDAPGPAQQAIEAGRRFDLLFVGIGGARNDAINFLRALQGAAPEQSQRVVWVEDVRPSTELRGYLANTSNPRIPVPADVRELQRLSESWLRLWSD